MATSVFHRVRAGSKLGAQYDQDGNLIQVESREDEEQNVKLAEILELLLAAGYFRARIKGLSPFDKVVGGMTWCITTCNFDIDVDLLFQENSTIGQKIALTEKIVSALPKMKCPHRLEPHQIQGLDFIHVFPVVQWLVKRAMETRQEMGDYVRAYSISQFHKDHSMPQDEDFLQRRDKAAQAVLGVLEVYKPHRKYRRQRDAGELQDEESRVHCTLLEYGRLSETLLRYGFSKQSKPEQVEDRKWSPAGGSQVVPAGVTEEQQQQQQQEEEEEEHLLREAEEMRIQSLMSNMAATVAEEGGLTASAVRHLVALQSEEIKLVASEYAEKSELSSSSSAEERFGPAQQRRRAAASLEKHIQQKKKQLQELQQRHDEVTTACHTAKRSLAEAVLLSEKLDQQLESLEEEELQADSSLLDQLRTLVTTNENLKQQEQEFRTHCREEMVRLQQSVEELQAAAGQDTEEEKERKQLIERQYEADREKLQRMRLLMARRNREIAVLQRKIDEVPSRAELTQYQKRFLELYSQVAATHKETKQFFTLYNTLDDKKVYLEKEVNLLNSIHDNFQQAMSSSAAREQFLRQMEQIVEGIKQNRIKMEKKKQENKMRRDQLNDQYLELLDQQRLYFKTVKDFKEECRKNEMLLSKLRAKGAS
ncbi:coiled-coil domain-containing protein 93 isoform X2 [Nelusetta ayraudi]|uniref:coiled-coil domain-containing protein 93 isoform X2 n=1 Tax=Nelusetta ayraudi TaxID=303726 RepID=UPI003F6F9A13